MGFSVEVPKDYVVADGGLWFPDQYERHLNPPEDCQACHLPYVQLTNTRVFDSVDEFLISKYTLPGETLEEATELTGGSVFHEQVFINNRQFTRMVVEDLFKVTSYTTMEGERILSFAVHFDENDDPELNWILESLTFTN